MFVMQTNVRISQRVVATLVACATVLFSIGAYQFAQAASLVDVSNTLSTSNPSVASSHTIQFEVPTGSSIASGDDITITFDSADDGDAGQNFASGDIGAAINVTTDVTFGVNVPAGTAATAVAEDTNSFTFEGITATAGDVIEIVVADGIITNPDRSTGAVDGVGDSYEIEIAVDNATTDTGKTRVVIVDTVVVSAEVPTVFTFQIDGLATSTAVNGTTTTGSSTATALDFDVLVADVAEVLGQRLTVETNANNGFVVTVEQDGDLQSANGAIIDSFTDGTYVNTPAAWQAPGDDITDELTWGHWGLTSGDTDLGGTFGTADSGEFANAGAGDLWVAASTTPRQVFSHNGPADGATADAGIADVAYQIQVTPLQEAADDYTATLTYIATPTF